MLRRRRRSVNRQMERDLHLGSGRRRRSYFQELRGEKAVASGTNQSTTRTRKLNPDHHHHHQQQPSLRRRNERFHSRVKMRLHTEGERGCYEPGEKLQEMKVRLCRRRNKFKLSPTQNIFKIKKSI